MNVNKINNAYHLEMKIFNHHDRDHGCLQIHAHGSSQGSIYACVNNKGLLSD